MRRVHGAFVAFAFSALASPARGAEISHVSTAGERGNPFDIGFSVRWERSQERATITRERTLDTGAGTPGSVVQGDHLRYVRTRHAVVPRIAVGLWHDLELHAELPYVLADDRAWRFGIVGGRPTGGVPGTPSTIEANDFDADGDPCTADQDPANPGVQCPLFPAAPERTAYHGGRTGDLQAGLAWAIFNGQKDDTKPFWVVGTDVTFPTATLYDPVADRGPTWSLPNTDAGDPAPFGERIWKWDVYTVLSRRVGPIDPYVKAHATTMFRSSKTYSNCDRAAELAALDPAQMRAAAVAACAAAGSGAGAKLPWIVGLTLGTELVAFESRYESQRVAIDLRAFADYTSPQRFYNELTDATGKLHRTGSYLTAGGLVGLYLRASRWVSLQATASLAMRTAHALSGEDPGDANFDWRYDAPGRRFRVSDVTLFDLAVAGVLQF